MIIENYSRARFLNIEHPIDRGEGPLQMSVCMRTSRFFITSIVSYIEKERKVRIPVIEREEWGSTTAYARACTSGKSALALIFVPNNIAATAESPIGSRENPIHSTETVLILFTRTSSSS